MSAAVFIVTTGTSTLSGYQDDIAEERTLTSMQTLDARLSSLSRQDGTSRVSLDSEALQSRNVSVTRSGNLTLTANGNSSCRAVLPLTSVRTESDQGAVVYEAGGLWRTTDDGDTMISPPTFTYENGTLNIQLVNVSGQLDTSSTAARVNVTTSAQQTTNTIRSVFHGSCSSPDTFTVTVTSGLHGAWADYLSESINASSITEYPQNETVRVSFDSSHLPEAFDERRNDVVDLKNTSQVSVTNDSIEVAKGVTNTYRVVATPVGTGPSVSRVQTLDAQRVYRSPMDVVFVLDESGSMEDGHDGGSTKMDDAQSAAKSFVGQMNASFDRAGVVGYDGGGHYYPASGQYLSDDFLGVENSIDSIDAGGSTNIHDGIDHGAAALDIVSNDSRTKVMVLLSDGEPTEPDDPVEAAKEAAEEANASDITIHTIGFGDEDELNEDLMRDIANETGGTYRYVAEDGDLSGVFRDLFAQISESKHIVREPITMGMAASGRTIYPETGGNDSHIATGDINGTTVPNVNDPTAPGGFSYVFDVNDSTNVSMNAYGFDCTAWERTGQTYENESANTAYAEARCVDIVAGSERTIPPSNASVFHDGQDISPLLDEAPAWWETNLTTQLAPYLNGTTLDLRSNEAIIVYDYPDADGGVNRFVVRYRVGRAISSSNHDRFLALTVSDIEISNA